MKNELATARWKPVDVTDLEPAADGVVRGEDNTLVVAGPGAGKTELLAQRACFLLQTGMCAQPRRILAISMKRDAARNLRDRVARRCGRELASRFDSFTFDSFSKSLVDRFLGSIPSLFRPAADYRVLDGRLLNEKKAFDFVRAISSKKIALSDAAIQGLNIKALWRAFVGRPIPTDGKWTNAGNEEVAAAALWSNMIHGGSGSALGFPMLGRLAEFLLRENPLILSALRKSYRFVFLDEFQDTSTVHYGLIRRAFLGSDAILTAVGDHKQRIMGWAGAMPKIFDHFETDFEAKRVPLKRNYRSSSGLVAIQSVIAKKLDPAAVEAISMVATKHSPGECRLLAFEDEAKEAAHLAKLIGGWINDDGLSPRKVCILCRMKPPIYTECLRGALAKVGVRSRIENELQDLLSEPLSECLLDLLRLTVKSTAQESWGRMVGLLGDLTGDDSESAMRKVVDSLLTFADTLRETLEGPSTIEEEITAILKGMMAFVGEDEYRTANPQYLQGDWYATVLKDLSQALSEARFEREWSEAIDEVEGIDSVPIMTTHKSKGLEYHTVVFVGLEDDAHFSFRGNQTEETCGFFVALSRAERRVIFTFSGVRPTRRGGLQATQVRSMLQPLYELLSNAGVEVEEIRTN
jgi:superfamily I DNA/RNA helicase